MRSSRTASAVTRRFGVLFLIDTSTAARRLQSCRMKGDLSLPDRRRFPGNIFLPSPGHDWKVPARNALEIETCVRVFQRCALGKCPKRSL